MAEKHRDAGEHLSKDLERSIAIAAGALMLDGRMCLIRRKIEARLKVFTDDSDYVDYTKQSQTFLSTIIICSAPWDGGSTHYS